MGRLPASSSTWRSTLPTPVRGAHAMPASCALPADTVLLSRGVSMRLVTWTVTVAVAGDGQGPRLGVNVRWVRAVSIR